MLHLLMKNWKLRVWCSLFHFFSCEPQSIWRKLLVLSWLYKFRKHKGKVFILTFKIDIISVPLFFWFFRFLKLIRFQYFLGQKSPKTAMVSIVEWMSSLLKVCWLLQRTYTWLKADLKIGLSTSLPLHTAWNWIWHVYY